MRLVSDLKGAGYLTSTGSVALLGAVSWKSASQHTWTLACLILGMALSVAGMMLRWRSHRLDQKKKDAKEAEEAQAARGASASRSAPGSSARASAN
jgi:hypothetical protein